ncbi:BnaCnng62580D, partial [Brassica napus]
RCFSPREISKAIRRKPYRDRVPPFSSPVISLITTNLICNRLGPHLLRPNLLRQYLLRLLLLKDYSDDFREVFYDSVRLRRRLPGMEPSSLLTSWKSSEP